MGLFDKLLNKMIEPDELNFVDFHKNFNSNRKKVKKWIDRIHRDALKMSYFLPDNSIEFLNKTQKDIYDLMQGTKSEHFSKCYASLLNYEKLYIAYYRLVLSIEQREKESDKILSRMADMYEMSIFLVIRHFLYERGEFASWEWEEDKADGGKFVFQPTEEGKKLIAMVTDNLNNISLFCEAVTNCDNITINEVFNNLNNEDLSAVFMDDPFEL